MRNSIVKMLFYYKKSSTYIVSYLECNTRSNHCNTVTSMFSVTKTVTVKAKKITIGI